VGDLGWSIMVIAILGELWVAVNCDCEGVFLVLAEWCFCDIFSGFCSPNWEDGFIFFFIFFFYFFFL
jgi:hypothetical protein